MKLFVVVDGTVFIGSWDSVRIVFGMRLTRPPAKKSSASKPATIHRPITMSAPKDLRSTFGCRHSFVYALDAATRTQKWKFSTDGSGVNNSLAVYQGMVYLGTSIPGILHALDPKTGTSIFQLPTGTPVFCSMAAIWSLGNCSRPAHFSRHRWSWRTYSTSAVPTAISLLDVNDLGRGRPVHPEHLRGALASVRCGHRTGHFPTSPLC